MKKILFVCVENAGRSQMAEGFIKKYAPNQFIATSAGTRPAAKIHPKVIQVMNEVGIKIGEANPKSISNKMLDDSIIVNMGCMDKESCPAIFTQDYFEWDIPDPKGKSIEEIRIIRDQIELEVKKLVQNFQP